ncbi:sulfate adenylyltransferase [bacterium]|nr:sulfate adenylyltransferase [bacterium]MBU1883826.1 sulfate adenylyltransferase [bacterium]
MASQRKNSSLFIDPEAASALEFLKAGLLYPATSLMNKKEVLEVLSTSTINKKTFPFPFILAPSGKRNAKVLKELKTGDELDLISNGELFATLIVDEIFEIDPKERLRHIYGTDDESHPGVRSTSKRLGKYAVCGDYILVNDMPNLHKEYIRDSIELIGAKNITAMMMAVNPLHRAHERLIRQSLENSDLVVIFLLKPYESADLKYSIRYESLKYFVDNYLPKNRVIIVPLESNYIFAGINEIIIDAIVAKNYGCTKLTIGQNHAGLGMYYDSNTNKSILDRVTDLDINISIASEYVYCNVCKTLVSTCTCPHGQHHHISYHSESILELLKLGIVPPAVLVRKEISALVLSKMFENRFKNLEKLYYNLLPVGGLLENHTEEEFYKELMKLYQTTSLT